ncbi:hypothetical protein B0H14DRAFT_3490262 [Mycena olivaceomarginata]|nr:hypothetical protein B0H14DRAFT_3490262 [Mycena olivaceomarginata]
MSSEAENLAAASAAATAAATQLDFAADKLMPPSPREPSPPLPPRPSGCPARRIRLPTRYRDELPDPPTPVPPQAPPPEPEPEPLADSIPTAPRKWVKTQPNAHGLYKIFPNRPTHDPEDSISLDDLCRSSDLLTENTETGQASTPPWFPFLNRTVARLMSWFHLGSTVKLNGDLDSIVHNVMLHEDFVGI